MSVSPRSGIHPKRILVTGGAGVLGSHKQRQPDISLVRLALNWTPTVQLDIELLATVECFEKSLRMNVVGVAAGVSR